MPTMAALLAATWFLFCWVEHCAASHVEASRHRTLHPCMPASSKRQALAHVPILKSLPQQLKKVFPEEPNLAVENAIADGLMRALGDEDMDLEEIVCNRDYSQMCPQGFVHELCYSPRLLVPSQDSQAGQMQEMAPRALRH